MMPPSRPFAPHLCLPRPDNLRFSQPMRWLHSMGCLGALALLLNFAFVPERQHVGTARAVCRRPFTSHMASLIRQDWRSSGLSDRHGELGVAQCNISHATAVDLTSVHCEDVLNAVKRGSRSAWNGRFQPRSTDGSPCSIRWYDAPAACDLLQKSDRYIIGIGDSLMRHLLQAIYTILSGNFKHGGMMHWEMCQSDAAICVCDFAFDDRRGGRRCREHSMALYKGPQSTICPHWRKNYLHPWFDWATVQLFDAPKLQSALRDDVAEYFGGRALVLANTAAWELENFEADKLLSRVYEAAFESARSTSPSVVMLPVTLSAPQANKPGKFWATQGPDAVRRWNSILRSWATERELSVLDTHAVTLNVTSSDGTHYASSVNVLLAQVLLNYVAELSGRHL